MLGLTREKLEPSVNHSSYLRRVLLGISEKQYHKKRATDIFFKSANSTPLSVDEIPKKRAVHIKPRRRGYST